MLINNEEHNELCVGIDLGTTNSVLSIINIKPSGDIVSKVIDLPRIVENLVGVSHDFHLGSQKKQTLPSCVYYAEENNYQPLVGDFAKSQYSLRPHLVARSIKSQMREPFAKGLAEEVIDKQPAEIAARILRHMITQAEKICRTPIKDAVITVPANFDPIMCQATIEAARLAGITVMNKDGSMRPVLLSEPNAVIYDLINQIHNGEIASTVLDLSAPQNVLVFDLGGGTLDITLHEIRRNEKNPSIVKVQELATNRYTLLGGDNFDEKIAAAMYNRYQKQYSEYPVVVQKIRAEEKSVVPYLLNVAEKLKIDLSMRESDEFVGGSGWDDYMDDDFSVGNNMPGIGYAYSDSFTKEEIETLLRPLLGEELTFDDYKRLDEIKATQNIIYPILDVLKKAEDKMGRAVKIDAVIMNGGMSKFYLITERLKKFFGLEPIVALDPDLAVARGASVYHYYLHRDAALREDMEKSGLSRLPQDASRRLASQKALKGAAKPAPAAIEWGKNILNDSLYLGLKNDGVQEIIKTGTELPYTSKLNVGYFLAAGTNRASIPIKVRTIDNKYRTIASGKLTFRKKYEKGAYFTFVIHMDESKVITMQAWTCRDYEGKEKIERGKAVIAVSKQANLPLQKSKNGTSLNVVRAMQSLKGLCKKRLLGPSQEISQKIEGLLRKFYRAGDLEGLKKLIVKGLADENQFYRERCFVMARRFGLPWTADEKEKLAALCLATIKPLFKEPDKDKGCVGCIIQAIYTLSLYAKKEQVQLLAPIRDKARYLQPCLYAYAKSKADIKWVFATFENSCRKLLASGDRRHYGISTYFVGIALMNDGQGGHAEYRQKALHLLEQALDHEALISHDIILSLLTIGWICDRRLPNDISEQDISLARSLIDKFQEMKGAKRSAAVAQKLLAGVSLTAVEEKFLLEKLEK